MHWRFLSVRRFLSNCTFILNLSILFLLAWRKILKFYAWAGFASSFKNFGLALAGAVFKCACKCVGYFFVLGLNSFLSSLSEKFNIVSSPAMFLTFILKGFFSNDILPFQKSFDFFPLIAK
jgi:hypothetical protein